jgi:hypothetical protein
MMLVELNCGEVLGISTEEHLEIVNSDEGETFEADWLKHEYLHKYRPR